MKSIITDFRLESIREKGIFRQDAFGEIIIWKQHEFHTWWNLFESRMEHPLSRTFINAFVDGFELKNTIKDVRGLFRKKKLRHEIERISSILGWGQVQLEQKKILNSAHPVLSVALGHYSLELYHEQRYKIRWTEPRSQIVQIETETSPQISLPQPHAKMPWSGKSIASTLKQSSVEMTTQQMNELRLEGERVVLIPLAPLERFFSGCLPYAPAKKGDWFNNQSTGLDACENILKIIIRTTAEMFLSSEQPVYIIDQSSWDAYIEHCLRERGWGSIETRKYNPSTFEFEFSMPMMRHFPLTLGLVVGMWERAHGRSSQISLREENDIFFVKIQSLLEYQNQ